MRVCCNIGEVQAVFTQAANYRGILITSEEDAGEACVHVHTAMKGLQEAGHGKQGWWRG